MGHICICIAVLLIALTAGMFLLAKTKKDNLGIFYSVASWFVIVVSLGCLLCCGIRSVVSGCHGGSRCEKEIMINKGGDGMQCHKKMGDHHKMMRMEMRGNCCDMKEGCMNKEEMDCCMNKGGDMKMEDCCKKKKEMKCVKDTVIVKNK